MNIPLILKPVMHETPAQLVSLDRYHLLTEAHVRVLRDFVRRRFMNDAECDDVVQETLLLACRYIGQFRFEASVSTWLRAIANNVIRVGWRRKQSLRLTFMDPAALEWLETGPTCHSATADLERKEINGQLHHAICQLPSRYRTVIELHDFRGLSLARVAEHLSTSVPAIKSRHHRAKAMLSKNLKVKLPPKAIYGELSAVN